MSLQRAATDVGDLVMRDFAQSPAGGAWCQYLDLQRQNPLTGGLGIQSAYERWCEPPGEPPIPPSQNFSDAGGVPCRDYRVSITAGDNQGNEGTSDFFAKGPIRLVRNDFVATTGEPRTLISLQGGDGVNCPVTTQQAAATSNSNVIQVYARINSITAVGGPLPDEVPVPIPPDELPPPNEFNFETTLNVDLGGFELNVPVVIGPLVFAPIGVFAPVSILPNADFNIPVDIDLNVRPQFGIDLNLEFVIPLGGTPSNPTPLPDAEPLPLPGRDRILELECEEVDYNRIERIVQEYQCCKPATNFQNVGTYTFSTPNTVFNISLPDNAVIVFIAIIPGDNTRVYKFAGTDAEFAHGNASITTQNDVISFDRIYVNNHAIPIPFELANKGLRLSLKEGTIASVSVGTFVPIEEE